MLAFFQLQIVLAVTSLLIPAGCWLVVLCDVADPLIMSNIASGSLIVCWLMMMVIPFAMSGKVPRQAILTAVIIFWGLITTIFPIIWDFTWALMNQVVYGATAEDKWLWYWWTYSVADTRFLRSDPLMIILEYWSGIMGLVQGYALYCFLNNRVQKAFLISMTVGCMQFYGNTAFLGTEAMVGFENIRPDFFSFYIKFLGLNGFWIIMPLVSAYCYMQLMKDPDYDVNQVVKAYFRS